MQYKPLYMLLFVVLHCYVVTSSLFYLLFCCCLLYFFACFELSSIGLFCHLEVFETVMLTINGVLSVSWSSLVMKR